MALKNGVFSVVAKNIEIKAQAITQESLEEDVTFIANSSQPNSSSSIQPEITIAAKSFQLAKQQRSKRVVTIIYQNSKIFPVFNDPAGGLRKRDGNTGDVVLAGKFKDAAIDNIEDAIKLKFLEDKKNGKYLPRCVFWDFNANGKCLVTGFFENLVNA